MNKIYLGFERFNLRVNYLACTNRRILTPDQSLTVCFLLLLLLLLLLQRTRAACAAEACTRAGAVHDAC